MSLFSDVSVPEEQPGLKFIQEEDLCEQPLEHLIIKHYLKHSYSLKMCKYPHWIAIVITTSSSIMINVPYPSRINSLLCLSVWMYLHNQANINDKKTLELLSSWDLRKMMVNLGKRKEMWNFSGKSHWERTLLHWKQREKTGWRRCSAQVHKWYFPTFLFWRCISWSSVGQMLRVGLLDHHHPCQFLSLLSSAISEPRFPHGIAIMLCLPRLSKKRDTRISCFFLSSHLCAWEAMEGEHSIVTSVLYSARSLLDIESKMGHNIPSWGTGEQSCRLSIWKLEVGSHPSQIFQDSSNFMQHHNF